MVREPQDFNDEHKQYSHITYKEYQRKVTKNPNEGIIIFVSTFFVLLLLFLGIAKQISPEVDVQIGDEQTTSVEDDESYEKSSIDERIKLLQEEDAKRAQQDTFEPELDEKVKLPDNIKKEEAAQEEAVELAVETEATPKPSETASQAPKSETTQAAAQPSQPASTSKVVVGYYATKEQAEVAKGIIAESGLNISPFVRSIGGAYTIQVGSYSTREKAQSVVNDLLKNNFPARILVE